MSRTVGMFSLPSPPVITPVSRCSLGRVMAMGIGAPSSGASPWSDAANTMIAYPVLIESPTTIYKFFWLNGSAAGGNSEVVLYDEGYNKVGTSTGSQGGSGNNVPQSFAPTGGSFSIGPGLYYCAMAHDATTTNQLFRFSNTLGIALFMAFGWWKQAVTLGSLPDPATPADLTNVAVPAFGLITRSVFDV